MLRLASQMSNKIIPMGMQKKLIHRFVLLFRGCGVFCYPQDRLPVLVFAEELPCPG